jgi:hypothetical protein
MDLDERGQAAQPLHPVLLKGVGLAGCEPLLEMQD